MAARFVRLGIAGFKSFADAASLEILPGLTGIVGPNGCGKSNVAEALRWAMGEANARHLRGGEMDDVIFAGTANRPGRNLAEVSLTIEDSEGGLPPPFAGKPELQVIRRIERGAGSTYRVNGQEARARDVQTLFADLASGARSSAMVSQGRVGSLVNARPEERRALIEEAAGITGLHARRAEAETRLRGTETNLDRAAERRALLERQLQGLVVQAKEAGRYRVVTGSLLDTEALLLATQQERARLAKTAAEQTVAEANAALQAALLVSAGMSIEVDRLKAVLPALRAAEAASLATAERGKMNLGAMVAERDRAQGMLHAAEQRHVQLTRDLSHAEATLRDAESIDARLVDEARRLQAEATAHPALLQAAVQETEISATQLREADRRANEAAGHASTAAAQTSAARQLLTEAEARNHRATMAIARLEAEQTLAGSRRIEASRLDAADTVLRQAELSLEAARAALESAEHDHHQAVGLAAQARTNFAARDTTRHQLVAETRALAEILAVKDGERWPPMIDSLDVPAGLEAALGAALGEELAAAANPVAARHWRPMHPTPPASIPGVRLSDTVSGPPLLARALGAIGLVRSDQEGDVGQASLAPGQSLVSAAGAVWRWDGYTIRAGTPTAAAVRLQHRNRLNALRSAMDQAIGLASVARAAADEATRHEQKIAASLNVFRLQQRSAEKAHDSARSIAQSLRVQAQAAEARHTALVEQREGILPEAQAASAALLAAQAAMDSQPDTAALRRVADETRAAVVHARQRDLAASRALDGLERTEEARQTRIKGIAREREDRRMRAVDLAGRVTDLAARAAEASGERAELQSAPDRMNQQEAQAQAAVQESQAAWVAHQRACSETEAVASQASADARLAELAGYAAREAVVRAEGQAEAAGQAWQAALARVTERQPALPPLPTPADTSLAAEDRLRGRLSRLARERDEFGPVNLRAEIEAGVIEVEMATIMRETEELATAIAKLRGSIGHLNREGRERLSAVFQQVDRHFQALFSRMFGGGRAHLALVGSDDPLLAGLEIFAQPPGKKLSALSLLSGGEQALTALSLIFAVFRCNPAPLCILDEVDAPLDDANVGRFCALLADMVQETATRFLVVTHHQVTMAAMDRLYGVTMQERGVSRLLSVDLSRAVDMIEAVAAE